MENTIETILEELYQADPSLREQDAQIRKLVVLLSEAQPSIKIDSVFRHQLLVQLKEKIRTSPDLMRKNSIFNFLSSMSYPTYKLAGAALAVVIVVAGVSIYQHNQSDLDLAFKQEISQTGKGAFGSLSGGAQNPASAPAGRGGGGGGAGGDVATSMMSSKEAGGGGGGVTGSAPAMYPQEYVSFRYTYKGESLSLTDKTVDVLRRVKGKANTQMASLVKSAGLGLLNTSKFSNLGVQGLNLMEDRDGGYALYVDFLEGMVSINQNWLRWPNPYTSCEQNVSSDQVRQTCYSQLQIKPSEVMSDSQAIAIADGFLQEYGINRSLYGTPEVMNEWRLMYERASAAEKSSFYIPEQVTITYPLLVNGQPAYDEGGVMFGLQVSVDVRNKKVSNVYNLTTQQYTSSEYDAETDSSVILEAVKRGNFRNYPVYQDANARIVNIEVGTPTRGYMRVFNYANNENNELLVPALIFPILNKPAEYYGQNTIAIPLAKELLQANPGGGYDGGGVMPMKGGVTEPAPAPVQ